MVLKIALLDAFPFATFTAEREFIRRCIDVLERYGHAAVKVSTTKEINEFDPDIVFSTHDLAPKLTKHFTIGPLWSPTQYYKDDEQRLKNIMSWDLVVPIDETTRQFAIDLHFPTRHRTAVSRNILFPSAPIMEINEPDVSNISLTYIGVHSDGARHEQFFLELLKSIDLHIYGPPEAWKFLPEAYRGPLPFDGKSVFEALNRHGAVLALHTEAHREEDTPSTHPFEGCAAKCLVITDAMPSLQHIFGDSLEYLDWNRPVGDRVQLVKTILQNAHKNHADTLNRIRAAHSIFRKNASLDAQLIQLLDEASQNLKKRSKPIHNDEEITVIVRCGERPINFVARAASSIASQTYQKLSILFVKIKDIDGFDELIESLLASSRFCNVNVLSISGDTRRSAALWSGMRYIKTPYFANLDDDDEWLPQHIADIMAVFKTNSNVDLVHSGGIQNNEEGRAPDLHPRLQGPDEWIDESRTLAFMSPNDTRALLKWGNVILSHSFVAKSSLLTQDVLDDPKLDVMEDVYLYRLLLARGARFMFNGRASAIWNWRRKSGDNSMLIHNDQWRRSQGERIVRRLRNFTLSSEYLGEDIVAKGYSKSTVASPPTRYDKLAETFSVFAHLTAMRIWIRNFVNRT